jgi:hypothetical protein
MTNKQQRIPLPQQNNSRTVLTAMNLSYMDMQISSDGSVLGREQIRELREQHGFCTECQGEPIRLYNIKKNRYNLLWRSKEPRNVEGECIDGKCLACHPNPKKGRRPLSYKKEPGRTLYHSIEHKRPSLRAQADGIHFTNDPTGGSLGNSRQRTTRFDANTDTGISNFGEPSASEHVPLEGSYHSLANSRQRYSTTHRYSDDAAQDIHISNLGESKMVSDSSSGLFEIQNVESDRSDLDNLETIYTQCRRKSFLRNVRPSSFRSSEIHNEASASETTSTPENNSFDVSNQRLESSTPSTPTPSDILDAEVTWVVSDQPEQHQVTRFSPPINTDCFHNPGTHSGRPSVVGALHRRPGSPNMEATSRHTPNHEMMVEELESLVKDLSASGNPDLTSDVVVNAMKVYPMVKPVQVFCLTTIWSLCKDDDAFKASIISSSAPDDILLAMMNHIACPVVQERGCGAIWALSVNQHNRILVSRAGAPARVVRAIMDHKSNVDVMRTGVGTLRALSVEPEIQEILSELNAKEWVAEGMAIHRSVACIQRDGCAFLSNVTVDLDEHHVSVATEMEVRTIVHALKAHQQEPSVITGACFALKNYTSDTQNLRMLASFPDAVELLEYAGKHSPEANSRIDAQTILKRLQEIELEGNALDEQTSASMADLVQQESVPFDAVLKIIDAMKNNESSVMIAAEGLRSLLTLAHDSDLHRNRINDAALKRVITSMRRHKKDASIQISGSSLLEVMAAYNEKCRYSIIDSNACLVIVNAMRQHANDISVQVSCCGAFRALSIEFECWFLLEQSGDAAIFQETMVRHRESSMVQNLVSEILTNLSRHSA